ncbi:aminotransferase class V-fold PLP-dependent enzyme [Bradyrhizobium sp. USDA 313]|uniref:aminotransferase class V-fold PLP-dependent enzyme n=1 Tax=unclassified Bradyrhizobium TaxID=2631580 RepID=UPI003511A2F5
MRSSVIYGDPPHQVKAGTPPIVEAHRFRRRCRLHQFNRQGAEPHARENTARLPGGVSGHQLRAHDRDSGREGPIISFEVKGTHAHDITAMLDRAGVAVRTGAHCAMPLLKCFSLLATCRVSLGLYNTPRLQCSAIEGGSRPQAGWPTSPAAMMMTCTIPCCRAQRELRRLVYARQVTRAVATA